jgi:hypothetical protein
VYRPPAQTGTAASRSGLTLALVTADNPLASISGASWSGWRCATLICSGYRVR